MIFPLNVILPDPHFSAKIHQILCSSILSTRTQYGTSVQMYHIALIDIIDIISHLPDRQAFGYLRIISAISPL